jgi:hypothetical protein
MRRGSRAAAAFAALLLIPGPGSADDLAAVSDRDLIERTREAVAAQDADAALSLLTEMRRRGSGIFAGEETATCEEVIDLPEGITDWKFRAVARQAYFRAAMSRRLRDGSCSCLFDDYGFDVFVREALGKSAAELTDDDRAALEGIRDEGRRETEARFRELELSCRAN